METSLWNIYTTNTHKSGDQILIKTDDGQTKGIGRSQEVRRRMCVWGGWVVGVIETNGVGSEGAIRTVEGNRESVLVCLASPEPARRLCLIRPVNLRDWGHPGTLIRLDGSAVPRQMTAIFTPFFPLSKHTHIITTHTHTVLPPLMPQVTCLLPFYLSVYMCILGQIHI